MVDGQVQLASPEDVTEERVRELCQTGEFECIEVPNTQNEESVLAYKESLFGVGRCDAYVSAKRILFNFGGLPVESIKNVLANYGGVLENVPGEDYIVEDYYIQHNGAHEISSDSVPVQYESESGIELVEQSPFTWQLYRQDVNSNWSLQGTSITPYNFESFTEAHEKASRECAEEFEIINAF